MYSERRMMLNISSILLVAYVAQAQRKDSLGTISNQIVDHFMNRALQAWPLHNTEVDRTMLGKPSTPIAQSRATIGKTTSSLTQSMPLLRSGVFSYDFHSRPSALPCRPSLCSLPLAGNFKGLSPFRAAVSHAAGPQSEPGKVQLQEATFAFG